MCNVYAIHNNIDKVRETFLIISIPPTVSSRWNWNRTRKSLSVVCTTLPLYTHDSADPITSNYLARQSSITHPILHRNRSYIARCRTVGIFCGGFVNLYITRIARVCVPDGGTMRTWVDGVFGPRVTDRRYRGKANSVDTHPHTLTCTETKRGEKTGGCGCGVL